MKNFAFIFLCCLLGLSACKSNQVDLIVYNARIYTVNENFDIVEAMAIQDGKILATGTTAEIQEQFSAKESLDAQGKAIYPGFIDAHAHFYGLGESLQYADLREAQSWDEILSRLSDFSKTHPEGWLLGRGWDQNDWPGKEFPDKAKLDELFPDRPVMLTRIDGHAAIVNQKAFEMAGLTSAVPIVGGEIQVKNNQLTGILIDNAMGLIAEKIPSPDLDKRKQLLRDAQQASFEMGLTTVVDCGSDFELVELMEAMQSENDLKMRLYVMLSDAEKNYDYLIKRGAIKTDRMNVRSFKVYGDGALGSRGACLLHPYSDKPTQSGFLLSNLEHYEKVAQKIYDNGFQMNTHAIGDSANRAILKIYQKVLGGKNDKRWRIEHAQVVNSADFERFGQASIIPSVQPTHATSDMYWAEDRLGASRVKGAYAYKQLLAQNGWMPLGTDFPVEHVNPMYTFFAATFRQDAKLYPAKGYQMENALSREEALKGMTIWAAKGNFEEGEKGSLEKGKFADFILLDQDIMKADANQILNNKVIKTYIQGEKVYERP
ncbi:MAG: amidohydrolase [Pedobacter sp.]|nr:MAG: amidohydrolase [Pedobacter sp.]